MKIFMSNNTQDLKFKNLNQAASYFKFTNQAASVSSAKQNIKAVIDGWQTTGATDSGTEARFTAYGYKVSIKK